MKLINLILYIAIVIVFVPASVKACDIDFEGPRFVCPNEINDYVITGLPPNAVIVNVAVVFGSIGTFLFDNDRTVSLQVLNIFPYTTLCVTYSASCGSGTYCIDITPVTTSPPSYNLIGPSPVCKGTEATYVISPPLVQGSEITFSVTNGTIVSSTDDSVTVLWDGSNPDGEICIEVDNRCANDQTLCLQIDVIQPPQDAIISDLPKYACVGDPFSGSINPSNFPDIEWSVVNATLSTPNNLPTINGIFSQPGSAEICVSLSVGCNNDATLCESIIVSLPPNPTLSSTELCDLEGYLSANNVRQGSMFLWELVNGPGNILFGGAEDAVTGYRVDVPGTYTIKFTEILGNCISVKEITVEFFEKMEVTVPKFICTENNGYRVTFTITGGKPPIRVNGIEVFGEEYVSDLIPYGTIYQFRINDNGLCLVNLSGVEDCPCKNSAGTMQTSLLTSCDSSFISAVFDSNAVLSISNISRFVLHDGKKDSLGEILAISKDTRFAFLPSMVFGKTYFIAHVVSDSIGSLIKWDDPCLQISNGQPIIFNRSPSVKIIGLSTVCGLESGFEAVTDSIPSMIKWTSTAITGVNNFFIDDTIFQTTFQVDSFGLFRIYGEVNYKGCNAVDSLDINFVNSPELQLLSINCNDSLNLYTLNLSISNGMPGFIFGLDSIFEKEFVVGPINSGNDYQVLIYDQNGCPSNIIEGNNTCNCFTYAGTLSQDTIHVCASLESASAISNGDESLDFNDTILYFLHDEPNPLLGKIYAKNEDGNFTFLPNMNLGQLYYISKIAGNISLDSIDFSDQCLSVSNIQPVIFTPDAEPLVVGENSICGKELTTSLSIPQGQTFAFDLLSSPLQVQQPENGFIDIISSTFGTFPILSISQNAACFREDTLFFQFNPLPEISVPTYLCNPAKDSVTVMFGIQNSARIFVNGVPTTGVYMDIFGTNQLPIEILLINDEGCEIKVTLTHDCQCSYQVGSMQPDTLQACGDLEEVKAIYNNDGFSEGDVYFFILHTSPSQTSGNILATSSDGVFSLPLGATYGTIYYISYVSYSSSFTNFLDDPCRVITPGQAVIFYDFPTLQVEIEPETCQPIANLTFINNADDITWSVLESPLGSTFTTNALQFIANQKGKFTLEIIAEKGPCILTINEQIELYDSPKIIEQTIDCQQNTFVVLLNIEGGSTPYNVNGASISGNTFQSSAFNSNDTLFVEIIDSRGCSSGSNFYTKECSCLTIAGSFLIDSLTLCEGEDIIFPKIDNAFLMPSQGINYAIYFLENGIETFYTITSENSLFYNSSFLGKIMVIRPWFGLLDTNGMVDRNDPCFAEGDPLYLFWHQLPSWTTPENLTTCEDQTISIPIEISGKLPATLFYTNEMGFDSIIVTNSVFEWLYTPEKLPLSISFLSAKNKFCFLDSLSKMFITSSRDWSASIENEFEFLNSEAQELYFETSLPNELINSIEWQFLVSDTTLYSKESTILISSAFNGEVRILMEDLSGCKFELFTRISWKESLEPSQFIFPNVLKLGSGRNGLFSVSPQVNIDQIIKLSVYDRWGNLQYQTKNKNNDEILWAGECIGGPCPSSVYVIFIQIRDLNGQEVLLSGDVTIITD